MIGWEREPEEVEEGKAWWRIVMPRRMRRVVRRKVERLVRISLVVVWLFLSGLDLCEEEYVGGRWGLEEEDSDFVPLGSSGSEA